MKKTLISILLLLTVMMSAQEVPTSFPRKFLIEHFTDESCKYCPDGMYCIVNYTKTSPTPHIWVSHHNVDKYNIPESTKLKMANGVSGTPSIALNRTRISGTSIAFHPVYLEEEGMAELIESKCDTTAEASVLIHHTYDAATRNLNITVSGQVANAEVTEYLLTVLIKENGLISKQADTRLSWKQAGYKEFLHPCIVRDLLCADAFGDKVAVENQAYSATYSFTMPENWVAENCCIVAYITPTSKKPIINAEEVPVVDGTDGGARYLPFAITEAKEPTNVTKLKFDSIALSKPSDDKLMLQLVASSTTRSDAYGPVKMVVDLEFNTSDTVVPIQTLDIKDGNELNTFTAGQVDLATQTFSGSRMAYYQAANMERLCYRWRIRSGQVVMDENGGFVATGKICNGMNFTITCTLPNENTAVENIVFDQAHVEKLMRNGQFIIRIDGVEYDLQGREITR